MDDWMGYIVASRFRLHPSYQSPCTPRDGISNKAAGRHMVLVLEDRADMGAESCSKE
jgi:hypothetical protein